MGTMANVGRSVRTIALFGAAAFGFGLLPNQASPLVRGGDVIFVADGDPADPPRIVGDFNGWEGGRMTPSADGRTYTLRVALEPAARIEYLVAYRDRFVLDAGNPLTVPAPAGPPRSELRMPGYVSPPPLAEARAHGSVDDLPFVSRTGDRRRIRVYAPASPFRAIAAVYVYDGDIFAGPLGVPSMLDSLIENNLMPPAVVVFIDAVDRHDDFEPGAALRAILLDEIVPEIERRYPDARAHRAMIGLSRSTVGALDACARAPVAFDACALVAPAVPRRLFDRLTPPSGAPRFIIETGTYDIPLVDDARALRDELMRRGASVEYHESPEGHNHTAFRARLPSVLMTLFP